MLWCRIKADRYEAMCGADDLRQMTFAKSSIVDRGLDSYDLYTFHMLSPCLTPYLVH